MRILDDAEVDGLDTVGGSLRIVLLQGSDEPGAHVAHGSLAVLKGTGVMQAGGLLLAVVGDNAVSLLGQDLLVVRLQEVVVAVDNGVLAVQDAEQRGGRTPGVVDVAVDTGLFIDLADLGVEVRHRHIVGGVLDTGLIEDVLVVVDDPEVRAERDSVIVAVLGSQLLQNAVELALVSGQLAAQGLEHAEVDQVGVAGDVLDGQNVQLTVAASQLGSQLGHVIGRAQVGHLDGDVGVALHIAVSQSLPVSSGVLIPQGPVQGDSLVAGAGALGSGLGGRSGALRGGSGVSGRVAGTAAGGQAQGHGTCQAESSNLLHFTHNVSPPNKKTFFGIQACPLMGACPFRCHYNTSSSRRNGWFFWGSVCKFYGSSPIAEEKPVLF